MLVNGAGRRSHCLRRPEHTATTACRLPPPATSSALLQPTPAPWATAACLQEELLQLKSLVSGLVLSKSSGAGAPFPIRAAAEVPAAPEAERYDVSGFRLAVQLQQGVLGLEDPGSSGCGAGLVDALSVEVTSPELPAKLRVAMAAELKRAWAASNPGGPACSSLWHLI